MSTVSDAVRHRLHNAFEELMGEDNANVLFNLLPPSGWADVARTSDLDQVRVMLTRDLDHAVETLRSEIRAVELSFDASLQREIRQRDARLYAVLTGLFVLGTAASTFVERLLG